MFLRQTGRNTDPQTGRETDTSPGRGGGHGRETVLIEERKSSQQSLWSSQTHADLHIHSITLRGKGYVPCGHIPSQRKRGVSSKTPNLCVNGFRLLIFV